MRVAAGTVGHLVDAPGQIGEPLRSIIRWVLHEAAGLEAKYLGHPRSDEVGDDDKARVIKTVHEEVGGHQVGDGFRPPWPLFARRHREDEAAQGGADARIRRALIKLSRYRAVEGGLRQIA